MNRYLINRRVATLLACAAAAVGGSLAMSSSALALGSLTCAQLYASGSSLQNQAQTTVFAPGWAAWSPTSCSAAGTMTYTSSSSGSGQNEFGENTGVLNPAEDSTANAGGFLDGFIGTDDPPNAGQLGNAEFAADEGTLVQITIPVLQAPVAVLLSAPAAFDITSTRVKLPNSVLDELYAGSIPAAGTDPHNGGAPYPANSWGAFAAAANAASSGSIAFTDNGTGGGTGGEALVQREARSSNSGTSYAFKNYLSQVDSGVWSQYASDFQFWPNQGSIVFNNVTNGPAGVSNSSGQDVAENTAATPGAIGYANSADALDAFTVNGGENGTPFTGKPVVVGGNTVGSNPEYGSTNHQIVYALVQNGTVSGADNFTSPVSSSQGNCSVTNEVPGLLGAAYSFTDSWYGVAGTDPKEANDGTGNVYYPICALTYDEVWKHYNAPNLETYYKKEDGGTDSTFVENSVKDFFTYIEDAGQSAINADFYSQVPTALDGKIAAAVTGIGD